MRLKHNCIIIDYYMRFTNDEKEIYYYYYYYMCTLIICFFFYFRIFHFINVYNFKIEIKVDYFFHI